MVLISVKWLFMHFDSCHVYIFYIQLFQKRIKIQINICRNTFYKERVHVYMCGFLTSSILIDEVSNYTGVILRIACFDLNCPLFTYLDFWHRLSSISELLGQFRESSWFTELAEEFRMTESDARWSGRGAGCGVGRVGWGRPRHVSAWQGRVG